MLLLDTSIPGSKGSMMRYADLVEHALQGNENQSSSFAVSRLSFPTSLLTSLRLHKGIATWLRHLWLFTYGRFRIWSSKTELVHVLDGSYAYLVPSSPKITTITTVHDLIPMLQQKGRFGEHQGSRLAAKLINLSMNGLQRSSCVLAVSSNTAMDIAQYSNISENAILTVPLALVPGFADAIQRMPRRDKQQREQSIPYILHVGNDSYYKNREGVIRIYSRLATETVTQLVLAGSPPTPDLQALIKDLSLDDRVIFVVDPDDSKLLDLYSGASLFFFPSLYEGFGWPPLEAMACGCPVVCSSEGALPEVVGDAALMEPVANEEGLALHCMNVLQSPQLAATLSEKGKERANEFNIERMRADLMAAYLKVVSVGK